MAYFDQKTLKEERQDAIEIRTKLLNSVVDDQNVFIYVDEKIPLPIYAANRKLFKCIISIATGHGKKEEIQDMMKQIPSLYRTLSSRGSLPQVNTSPEPYKTPIGALYSAVIKRVDVPENGVVFKIQDENIPNKEIIESTINKIILHSRVWTELDSDRNEAITKIKKEIKEFVQA